MRKNIARTAAVITLGLAAVLPLSGVASAHEPYEDTGYVGGAIAGEASYNNLGGPAGITNAQLRFFAFGIK